MQLSAEALEVSVPGVVHEQREAHAAMMGESERSGMVAGEIPVQVESPHETNRPLAVIRLACGHEICAGQRAELKADEEDGGVWMGFNLVGTEVIDPAFTWAYCSEGDGWQRIDNGGVR